MIPLIYFVVNLLHALWHSVRIKKGELILSRRKAAEVIIINAVLFLVLIFFYPFWPLILFAVLTRLAFYDALLNLFRGKELFYEGEIKRKKSWSDWIENKIGFPTWVFRIIYLAAYITYLIIYYAT